MVDLKRLNKVIDDSGMKVGAIAERLGISRFTLYKKLGGETTFTVPEANMLASVLHLSTDDYLGIFFAQTLD